MLFIVLATTFVVVVLALGIAGEGASRPAGDD